MLRQARRSERVYLMTIGYYAGAVIKLRILNNPLGMSYFALQDDLEKLFGRPVDLVPKEGLHRVIRDQVLADAQVLYAA